MKRIYSQWLSISILHLYLDLSVLCVSVCYVVKSLIYCVGLIDWRNPTLSIKPLFLLHLSTFTLPSF